MCVKDGSLCGFTSSTHVIGVRFFQAKVGDGLEAVAQLAHRLSSDSNSEAQSSVSCGPAESQTPTPDSTQPSQSLASNDADNNQSPVSNDGNHSQSPVSTKAWHSQHVDLLVVDAGSGDASVAMSCPPAAFLEPEFLGYAKQVLSPGGMLVINCVSRAEAPYKAAVKALQVSNPCLRVGSLFLFLLLSGTLAPLAPLAPLTASLCMSDSIVP